MLKSMEVSAEGLSAKDELTEAELLEPLFIYEEGDEIKNGANGRDNGSNGGEASSVGREAGESVDMEGEEGDTETEDFGREAWREKEEQKERETGDERETEQPGETNLEEGRRDRVTDERQTDTLEEQRNIDMETDVHHGEENHNGARSEKEDTAKDTDVEKGGERKGDELETIPGLQIPVKTSTVVKSRDRLSPPDAQKQIRRLTPDFPDSLYELLCSLQEGRRMNDQRCSFGLERRCHSEPSTPVLRHKVVFSSMTSIQKEEFFELLATSQGRRLDDQRAELRDPTRRVLRWRNISLRKNSLKDPEIKEAPAKPVPKEDLYNMILTSQAQGRMEDQRCAAPGPMDDEDFFSLLLKVQGGRMDEQRTEMPVPLRD
ncbi:G-protein-signaling modulator 1 [Brienomyrus brachyistius]|uniref:G-protein-signaling modulator 1 n=1 Tax=Brienomyrus brachyistius TaxID=42636 RepID=UPI0020B41902|nr:G-protein-signaling modulator 1 [Brienomyrus brachyistius]XP_048881883.1 G-protein-signaling modulator 1 [Brienomyrus brachyistius]XP_048881884.1 G-protein-signaling modulator 1 [Brienomyrus brachyistius]